MLVARLCRQLPTPLHFEDIETIRPQQRLRTARQQSHFVIPQLPHRCIGQGRMVNHPARQRQRAPPISECFVPPSGAR